MTLRGTPGYDQPEVTLTGQVWYPTQESDEDIHAYDGLVESLAMDGVEPDCSETRPVLVFSHGNSGMRYQSIFLTEFLASL